LNINLLCFEVFLNVVGHYFQQVFRNHCKYGHSQTCFAVVHHFFFCK